MILAGGSGTRLWPISRTNFPKQFVKLKNMDRSIFQMSLQRCLLLTGPSEIFIVTNSNYKFLVLGQIEELGYKFDESQILVEPAGKNTLPAVYYGVKEIKKYGNEIIAVFPSDHLMADERKFQCTINKGKQLVDNYIVTYGVRPGRPHTGYGYIKPQTSLVVGYKVDEFKEKPDIQGASTYLEQGYLWNSGIFMFRADFFTMELRKHCEEVYQAFQTVDVKEAYQRTPSISMDYGIMEKSQRVAVIPLDVKWSDLGSFDTFYDQFAADGKGNISFGSDILIDADNNLIYTGTDKAVALIGVDDLIIVDERDALLICKREQSQKVKAVVERLKASNDTRADFHLTTYRPWGSYTILEEGLFYKIKRITVLPGKKLSYQLHHHRSEHWIVVSGTAKVTVEGEEYIVRSGESTFFKSGLKHRLGNPGKVPLEVIEVQLGQYLAEDDIVRLDDDFGRC
ncbi:MAG: mannose-1-phosphate guanylyltransferase/mannose-6-phosphate isomerase [Desulfotomaculaceae bacterium]